MKKMGKIENPLFCLLIIVFEMNLDLKDYITSIKECVLLMGLVVTKFILLDFFFSLYGFVYSISCM